MKKMPLLKPRILHLALLLLLVLPDLLCAQEAPGGLPAVEEKSLLDLYNTGGFLMHFILLCSIGTIAVGIYCFLQISSRKMAPKALIDSLTGHMQNRDAGSSYQLCLQNPCSFSHVTSAGLLKVNFDRELANKLSMEQAAGEALAREETRYMIWVNYLNVFATIAPMLGLLGTVTGMITSFDMLAAGRSEPQDLAGGIGEAMLTTAAGLIVGVPAMFFYFFFRNRLLIIISDIQKKVTFLIDVLSGELQLEGAVETAAGEEEAPIA